MGPGSALSTRYTVLSRQLKLEHLCIVSRWWDWAMLWTKACICLIGKVLQQEIQQIGPSPGRDFYPVGQPQHPLARAPLDTSLATASDMSRICCCSASRACSARPVTQHWELLMRQQISFRGLFRAWCMNGALVNANQGMGPLLWQLSSKTLATWHSNRLRLVFRNPPVFRC